MSRNNLDRTGAPNVPAPPVETKDPLHFVSPTEFVELPSRGNGYPEGHALYGKEVIEIRFMTAKDEDILTSESLLRNGLALDRLLENLLIDKSINVDTLLIGDKNAILIAARASAYGNLYETKIKCPSCGTKSTMTFDLNDKDMYSPENIEDKGVTLTEAGTYKFTLPRAGFETEIRLLTSKDERKIIKRMAGGNKGNKPDTQVTDQYKSMILSVNGVRASLKISKFIEQMPIQDSRYIRSVYKLISPNIEIRDNFCCNSCGYEQELEVPFGTDFFWPDAQI